MNVKICQECGKNFRNRNRKYCPKCKIEKIKEWKESRKRGFKHILVSLETHEEIKKKSKEKGVTMFKFIKDLVNIQRTEKEMRFMDNKQIINKNK